MRLDHAARHYLGVPFGHQGRNPQIEIDCIGLLYLACRDAGLACASEDRNDYSQHPHAGLLESNLIRIFGDPLPLGQMQAGDIVALRYGGPIRHVGIVGEVLYGGVPYLSLIHTDRMRGCVTEHRITEDLLNPRKRPCIAGVYRPEPIQ